jgi:hypothetical protein
MAEGGSVVGVPPPRKIEAKRTSDHSGAVVSASRRRASTYGDFSASRLAEQRRDVSRREMIQPRVRVEVAVAAARQAERDVHVQAGALGHFPPPFWSTRSAAMNASCGTSTLPTRRIFAFPAFCFSRSFRFRVMSPP